MSVAATTTHFAGLEALFSTFGMNRLPHLIQRVALPAIFAAAVSGCASFGTPHQKIEGLQGLSTRVVLYDSLPDSFAACSARYSVRAGSVLLGYAQGAVGCAEINLFQWSCTVHAPKHYPSVIDHELLHCQGYDHGTGMRQALEHYESLQANRADFAHFRRWVHRH